MKTVYLDYAATTPVDARVLKAMLPYFCEQYGNPSSLYSFGREARQAVGQARRQLASLLGAEPDEIFFTSGGSESDNWVIRSLSEEALRHGGGHIITTKVEHHAVLRACEALPSGIEVTYLDVDSEGRVQPEAVESSLRPDTFLVSVMAANNEVGTIEPIAEIGAICRAHGVFFHTDAVQAVEDSYAEGVSDEFIKPVLLEGENASTLQDGDGLFFYNFRADRMRELSQAFVDADFTGFERGRVPQLAAVASMTAYDAHFPLPVAFPKESVTMGLGEVVSQQGMHQLRLAETEKYAHVTYFFNGGVEEPLPLEDRILVPSPREVQTYDQKPAMSAREVTDKFVEAWQSGQYDLVVCNLANGDMVGHTGVLSAAVEACAVVDECVGRMVAAVEARKGRMLLIADHGNCEVMKDGEGKPQTAHTTNPVPCILLDASGKEWRLHDGKLADVAPTLLRMWGIAQPEAMTGTPLVEEAHVR